MIAKRVSSLWLDPAIYLSLVYLCLSFPLFALQRHATGEIVGEVNFTALLISYIILAIVAASTCRYRSVLNNLITPGDIPFLMFCATVLASVFVHSSLDPFIRISVLLLVAFGVRTASMSARFFTGIEMASLALLLFLIAAVIVLGPPVHRRLGGIHPNAFGGAALSCAFLATFSSQRRFEILAAICLSCALLVSSRYSMIGIFLVYSVYWILNIRRAGLARLSVAAIFICALVADFLFSSDFGVLGGILQLNNESRGLSSGLTGRDETWANFPYQFDLKPLFGYGFRNRDAYAGTHNAFLNLILENGLLGSFAFFLFFLHRFASAIREAIYTPRHQVRGRFLSGMIAFTFGAMLQPQLLNFGDSFGFTFLLILFAAPGSERAGKAHRIRTKFFAGRSQFEGNRSSAKSVVPMVIQTESSQDARHVEQ